MATPTLQSLYNHMEWADARLWTALLSTPEAHTIERVRELIHHLHLVQRLYLLIWRGEPLEESDAADFAGLEEICFWARTFYEPARLLIASADDAELSRQVEFPWAAQLTNRFGTVHPASLEESMLQIVVHTAHHRAQLCTRIRELGGRPPLIDFIAWIWLGKPQPSWPDLSPS